MINKTRLICPITSCQSEQIQEDIRKAIKAGADTLELRADLMAIDADELDEILADIPLDTIVTLRTDRQGGKCSLEDAQRMEFFKKAIQDDATWIDIEDDTPADLVLSGNVILSHHNFEKVPEDIKQIVANLEQSSSPVNKIAFKADSINDAFTALDIVKTCKKPTLALAMGESGVISRILAKKAGAFGTFAALDDQSSSAPGQPMLEDMKKLYRWDAVNSATQLFGVIASPVGHSMSPQIHNSAFDASDYNGLYLPLLVEPGWESFERFMQGVLQRGWMNWRGFSVTIPHKENAIKFVGPENCDPLAVQIGAVNTIVIEPDGTLRGYNTDYQAIIASLCDAMGVIPEHLVGRPAAIIGAGGVSRAAAAALKSCGAEVTIYNRTFERAEKLAEEFECTALLLENLCNTDAEILINGTSLGMYPDVDKSPLEEIPQSVSVVFDTIYNPMKTKLMKLATKADCTVVSGVDMFVNQAAGQFTLWTQLEAPFETMRHAVISRLS